MSRDLTKEELQELSKWMKSKGFMSYEEFCKVLEKQTKEEKTIKTSMKRFIRSEFNIMESIIGTIKNLIKPITNGNININYNSSDEYSASATIEANISDLLIFFKIEKISDNLDDKLEEIQREYSNNIFEVDILLPKIENNKLKIEVLLDKKE
jgi:hypothetical protein